MFDFTLFIGQLREIMDSSSDVHNAALHLEGMELEGGWKVGPLNVKSPSATGGLFSVSYMVAKADGSQGFLKVIDLMSAFGDINALQTAVNEYISERDLLVMCGERRLSRVVLAIGHGEFAVPGYQMPQVNYIIFELATSDVRVALSQASSIELVIKLQMLHDLTLGLRQLHRFNVAHQDLKPSNFLVFGETDNAQGIGKLADLGRAYRDGYPTMHDSMVRPGDRTYAPPEQLYRHEYEDTRVRRYAADLYQLGSLATFIFGGVTMNSLLAVELAEEHHWDKFGDGYAEVLPYLVDAHNRAIVQLRHNLPGEIAESLSGMIRYLTEPDATRRGHPANRKSNGSPFSLERVVSEADLMVRRAAVAAAGKK